MTKHRARRRTGPVMALFALLLAILAFLYARCGDSFGFLGLGEGPDSSETSSATDPTKTPADTPPTRCQLRLDATGLKRGGTGTTAGTSTTIEAALEACRPAGAEIVVTGDAHEGTWADLQAAFKKADLPLLRL